MLGDQDAIATVAVRNLKTAKKFYEGTLGLKLTDKQQHGSASYRSGSSIVFVYESRYAGTNKATAVTWVVGGEVDAIVKALKGKGVAFEHYELPNTTLEGDVHVMGNMRVAWFKDPDGNIHSIVSG